MDRLEELCELFQGNLHDFLFPRKLFVPFLVHFYFCICPDLELFSCDDFRIKLLVKFVFEIFQLASPLFDKQKFSRLFDYELLRFTYTLCQVFFDAVIRRMHCWVIFLFVQKLFDSKLKSLYPWGEKLFKQLKLFGIAQKLLQQNELSCVSVLDAGYPPR